MELVTFGRRVTQAAQIDAPFEFNALLRGLLHHVGRDRRPPIYPILWLMRYLFLGADYDVVRVAYPLVCWHEPDQQPTEAHLRGTSERDWFAANQAIISRACQNSKIGGLYCT